MQVIRDKTWLKEWQVKRKKMTCIAYILVLLYGLEILSVIVSMIYYIRDSFHMTKMEAGFYYCLIETFCGIGQVVGSIVIGRYVDKTRNLRLVMLMNMAFIMFGNLLYAMPFHLAFLMVGRFLCGMNESLQTAICGEFRRCYKPVALMKVLGYYELIYAIGTNTGPGMPIIFKSLDIRIGSWIINRYNVINLLIVLLTFITFIISWFVLHDLSKEYDFKLLEEEANEDKTLEPNNANNGKIDFSDKVIRWKGLLQVDIMLLSLTYGVYRLTSLYACFIPSMIATSLFGWPVDYLSMTSMICGVSTYATILVLIQKGVFKGRAIFFVYIIGSIMSVMILIGLGLPRAITFIDFKSQFTYIALIISAKCFIYFVGQTQGKILIFDTVNDESASFIDGFRSAIGSGFRLLGLITSFQYFKTPIYFMTPVVLLQLVGLVWILYRKLKRLK